jgi:hypothetical protein
MTTGRAYKKYNKTKLCKGNLLIKLHIRARLHAKQSVSIF